MAAWAVVMLGFSFLGVIAALLLAHFGWDRPIGINCRYSIRRCRIASSGEVLAVASVFGAAGLAMIGLGWRVLSQPKKR